MRWLQGRSRTEKSLIGTATALGILFVSFLLFLALVDWNAMRGPVGRFLSDRVGRTVEIRGPLEVDVWSLRPRMQAHDVAVGNAPWDRSEELMGTVARVDVQMELLPLFKGDLILPRVAVERPDIYLHRESPERANWVVGAPREDAGDAPDLPVVRDFLVEEGKLRIVDEVRKLTFRGKVRARENATEDDPAAFRIEGDGELNGRAFSMDITGGPLINLDPGEPYPFRLDMRAADIEVLADGVVPEPFDLDVLTANVKASGADLADLWYFTGLAIPNTPPYALTVSVRREGSKVSLSDLDATLGRSDLRGRAEVELSGERPKVSGEFVSSVLDMADVAAAAGARPASSARTIATPEPVTEATPAEPRPPDALFPDAVLQVTRVRGTDADVYYTAETIRAGIVPIEQIAAHIVLQAGVINLDPLAFDLPQGRLTGTVKVDAREDIPFTEADLRLANADLEQFRNADSPKESAPLAGPIHARAQLEGRGESVHRFAAHANGSITAIVPQGEIRAALAELTGINLIRGLGLLIAGNEERAEIRCGIASFDVREGVMHAKHIEFDTSDVLISGGGEVRLGPEEVDLSIKGEPKEARIGRVRSPIQVNGTLRDPEIGISPGKVAGQAGIAAALAVIAPPAAILAFVDPGLTEDANCAALMSEANAGDAAPAQ